MAKKEMKGSECGTCHSAECKCSCYGWCKAILGIVILLAGLLIIWPKGWFTFEHVFGVLVVLMGLKFIYWGLKGCACH